MNNNDSSLCLKAPAVFSKGLSLLLLLSSTSLYQGLCQVALQCNKPPQNSPSQSNISFLFPTIP